MARDYDEQSSIRQYLLRQLSDEQQQEIEQRLLVEDELFEELETTEAQLIDDYVAGQLTDAERQQFDEHFLTTPKRQQDLQFARVLRRYVASNAIRKNLSADRAWWQPPANPSWVLRVAAGLIAVALIGLALWFAIPRASAPETLASITLTMSAANRAEAVPTQKISLPSSALKIVLQLPDTAAPGENYRVRLISGDGETRTLEVGERDARTVSVVVPAAQLKRGPYALKLLTLNADGTEQPVNGSYQFAIE